MVEPGTPIPADLLRLAPDQQRRWIDQNARFTYVAKGQVITGRWGNDPDGLGVVAYETKADGDGLSAALFRDGHVERVPMDEIMKLVP